VSSLIDLRQSKVLKAENQPKSNSHHKRNANSAAKETTFVGDLILPQDAIAVLNSNGFALLLQKTGIGARQVKNNPCRRNASRARKRGDDTFLQKIHVFINPVRAMDADAHL